MSDATEYYQRGLSFLSEKPPNLIKALSLIRKSKRLFERQGDDRESEAAQDKIFYIYMSITEKEYNQAKSFLTVAAYEKALQKTMDAIKHLEKSHPKYSQKTLRKIQNLIEQISIELLFDIERNPNNLSMDESLSKLHYIERIILEIFYPHLKPMGSVAEIPENFITEIQNKRKMQRAFINIYEYLGNQARKIGKNYIQEGNITQGAASIELAEKLYKTANFKQRIQDLKPLYRKIHEAQGDLSYTYAERLVEEERLEKARNQLRNARNLYTKSQNDKKKKAAENLFLRVSVELGKHYLEDAEKAMELNDLKSTVDYLKRAHDFFEKINHKKLTQKTEVKLNGVYTLMGDKEAEFAETVESSNIADQNLELEGIDIDLYSFHSEFFITSEVISQQLQHLHGASYFYQKAHNDIQFKKIERKILVATEKLANLYLNQGKKDIKNRKYEKAHIHLKKSKFHIQKEDRRVRDINSLIQKIIKKINKQKLEKIKNVLIQYNQLISEKLSGSTSVSYSDIHSSSPDQQYRCKNCGDWVPGYYYDSIQERCFECRAKIHCDECRKNIGPNEIYQKCADCGGIFCLECAERVFDFIQKKCMSCRVVEICEECQAEARPTESFQVCPSCQKLFCNDHFDFSQGVCTRCRKAYSCIECDRELLQEDAFICDVCNRIFCVEHFDMGRNTCKSDAKEEICAKCGTVLKIEDHANKCKKCQFMYCDNHYSDFHEICMVCLPKLECSTCAKDLSKEKFFECTDCHKVFCKEHFRSTLGRCLECSQKIDVSKPINIQSLNQTAAQMYDLQANTLKPIIEKYNNGEVLESEEIAFLMQHQVNLPADEVKYMNIGATDNIMVLIRQPNNKPYVVIVPESPIHLDTKYFGDLFRKLIPYLPEVPETIDGITSIVNLLFYAANNPRWVEIYEILQQTLLKIGIDVLQVLVLVFRKATIQDIAKTISNSIIVDVFSGTEIVEALKFIQTEDSAEDEVGLFSSDERLDQFLKVLYNLNRGNVLRAAEIFALFEMNP